MKRFLPNKTAVSRKPRGQRHVAVLWSPFNTKRLPETGFRSGGYLTRLIPHLLNLAYSDGPPQASKVESTELPVSWQLPAQSSVVKHVRLGSPSQVVGAIVFQPQPPRVL